MHIVFESVLLSSELLERDVKIDLYLPAPVSDPAEMSLLLINDGQDLPKMPFAEILDELYECWQAPIIKDVGPGPVYTIVLFLKNYFLFCARNTMYHSLKKKHSQDFLLEV